MVFLNIDFLIFKPGTAAASTAHFIRLHAFLHAHQQFARGIAACRMLGGKGTHRRPLALVPLRLALQFGKLGLEAGQSFLEFR